MRRRWLSRQVCPQCHQPLVPTLAEVDPDLTGPRFRVETAGKHYGKPMNGDDAETRIWVRLLRRVALCAPFGTFVDLDVTEEVTFADSEQADLSRRMMP